MKVAWNKTYNHPLPDGHRFPMIKYDLIPEQLLREGVIAKEDIFDPEPAKEEDILLVHTPEYLDKLKKNNLSRKEERATGFPVTFELYNREINILGGTIKCVEFAKRDGVAFNTAGGTHHAFTDRGEGFCLLNDIAVSSAWALKNELAKKILVVDLDVHQGNGTAQIFQINSSVFTFSIHGAHNYPLQKQQSNLDIGVKDGISDSDYLDILESNLVTVFKNFNPDFVHYQCGVDVLKTDKLGRLGLTQEGCGRRDEIVLQMCKEHNTPVVCTMGGGYSENIRDIVNAHCNTYKIADRIF